jgi:hypothetical protein
LDIQELTPGGLEATLRRRYFSNCGWLSAIAGIAAIFVTSTAPAATTWVAETAILGAILAVPIPFVALRLIGRSESKALTTLGWFRRTFASSASPRAQATIDIHPRGLSPEFYDAVRQALELTDTGREDDTLVTLRASASAQPPADRDRADAAIAVVQSIWVARIDGDWVSPLVRAEARIRDDIDAIRPSGMRRWGRAIGLSIVIVAGLSTLGTVVIAVFNGH